uniref:Uncharacterized protein n=1 Tax=viral metagenome TaxID=1070528 RepID=A0A6M3JHA0_9ZZZZ
MEEISKNPMTRKQLINQIVYAGYHNDLDQGTRLFVENRISMQAYRKAFERGRLLFRNGMKCNCPECESKDVGDIT